jgi:glycine cleavage system aminomethyltransferase T
VLTIDIFAPMPLLVSAPDSSGPLDTVLRRAGAVFGVHGRSLVALNYGSAAGELAACVHGVGLVDHSDTAKLVLEVPPAQLSDLSVLLTGRSIAAGQAFYSHGAWWCGAAPGRAVILCEAVAGDRLRDSLRSQRLRRFAVTVHDHSEQWAAIELIGHDASKVLSELGAYDDPVATRVGSSFTIGTVNGTMVNWLLESEHYGLALVERSDALTVWQAIERVGRGFGITYVGEEASARYRLLEGSRYANAPSA